MSSSRNWENQISSHSSEGLKDVEKRVKDVDISNREAKRFRKEHEAHDEAEKNHFPKMVKLNVGGHLFSTSLATLTKDPGSMLHAMFSGRFDAKPSGDGSYFIDRDGTHFRHILNYLRTGQLIVPQDEIIRVELLAEADFYQIEGIVNPLRGSFFKDSVILSLEQRQTLVTWLKETGPITISSEKLLYCASRDGWRASDFHSCCDNQGPTVTVIKSGNYIFGGYTEKSWNSGYFLSTMY